MIDENLAHTIAEKFGTPLFIMDERGVIARYRQLANAVRRLYPHSRVAISYKTNLLHGLMALLHGEGADAEVVSGVEYAIAKKLIRADQKIIFNGPMKLTEELKEAILDGAILNCDHEDEIDQIEQLGRKLNRSVPIGLRVYFVDHDLKWNRFGFPIGAPLEKQVTLPLIQRLIQSKHVQLSGLHAHIGTNIRDMHYFSELGKSLSSFASDLKKQFHLELRYIDVGGGLAGISPRVEESQRSPHPLPDLEQYAKVLIDPLLPYLSTLSHPAELYFEPGRTLFEPYGSLLTKVIGRRPEDREGMPGYICDAGINTLSTSYAYNFPVKVFSRNTHLQKAYLYGPTCNQKDQLCQPIEVGKLNPGDLLIFSGVGSYCMAFSYSFIRPRPGVVLWRDQDEICWLRKPESLNHMAQLECFPKKLQGAYR